MAKKSYTKLWEWQERIKKGEGQCNKCKGKFSLTVDHIIPQSFLYSIGLDEAIYECEENFQIMCRFCNRLKKNGFDFNNPKTLSLLKHFIEVLEKMLREAKEK